MTNRPSHESMDLPDSKAVAYAFHILKSEIGLLESCLPHRSNPETRDHLNLRISRSIGRIESHLGRLEVIQDLADGASILEEASFCDNSRVDAITTMLSPKEPIALLRATCRDYRSVCHKQLSLGGAQVSSLYSALKGPLEQELCAVEDRLLICLQLVLNESPQVLGPLVGGFPCEVGENPY